MNVDKMRHQLARSYQHSAPCVILTIEPRIDEIMAAIKAMGRAVLAPESLRRHGPEGER